MYYLANFCRLCLTLKGDFNNMCNDNIIEKASACIGELEFDYNLPNLICNKCLETLEAFFNFRNRCLQSEFLLNRYIELLLETKQTKEFTSSKLSVNVINNFGINDNTKSATRDIKYENCKVALNSKYEEISPVLKDCKVKLSDLGGILGLRTPKSKELFYVEDVQKHVEVHEENLLADLFHIDEDDDVFLEEEDDENFLQVADLSQVNDLTQFSVHSNLVAEKAKRENENTELRAEKRKSADCVEQDEKRFKCSNSEQDLLVNETEAANIISDEDDHLCSSSDILTNITERVKLRRRQVQVDKVNETFQENFIKSTCFKLPLVETVKPTKFPKTVPLLQKKRIKTTRSDVLSVTSNRPSCINRFDPPTPTTKSKITTDTDIENDIAPHYISSVKVKPAPKTVSNSNNTEAKSPRPTTIMPIMPKFKLVSRNELHKTNSSNVFRKPNSDHTKPKSTYSKTNNTTLKFDSFLEKVSSNELYQANFSNILQLSSAKPLVTTSSNAPHVDTRPFNITFHNIGQAQQNVQIQTIQINKPLRVIRSNEHPKKRTLNQKSLLKQYLIIPTVGNMPRKTADERKTDKECVPPLPAINTATDHSAQSFNDDHLDIAVTDSNANSLINNESLKNTIIEEHNYSTKSDEKVTENVKYVLKDKPESETKSLTDKSKIIKYLIDDPLNMLRPVYPSKKRCPNTIRHMSKKMKRCLLQSAIASGKQKIQKSLSSLLEPEKQSDSESSDVDVETISERSQSDLSFNISLLQATTAKQADLSANECLDALNKVVLTDKASLNSEDCVNSSYFEDECNSVLKDIDVTFIDNDFSHAVNQHSDTINNLYE